MMKNDIIGAFKYIGLDFIPDAEVIGSYITTLGEGEKLKISNHVSSWGVYFNDNYIGEVLSAFEISKILKEQFKFPFYLGENEEITPEYLKKLGFKLCKDEFIWSGMFSPIYLEVKCIGLDFEITVNKKRKYYLLTINMFEWFLEGIGLLRVLKINEKWID